MLTPIRLTETASAVPSRRHVVVVIDDHALTLECIARILRTEVQGVDVIGLPAVEELSRLSTDRADLVLLNIGEAAVNDAAVRERLAAIEAARPQARIALLAQRDCPDAAAARLPDAVQGIISTAQPLEIAIAAIRLVLIGGTYFHRRPHADAAAREAAPIAPLGAMPPNAAAPQAAAATLPIPMARPIAPEDVRRAEAVSRAFTPREAEVLAALWRGRSNKVIAGELNLSENTVKVHVRHIMRKLRATNRTQAALMAQRLLVANPDQPAV
jgi:DNA-binding NarL/FixJ family response regulator